MLLYNEISSKPEFKYRASNSSQKSFLTHLQILGLFYRVNSASNSFRSKENFNALLPWGSEDICLIALVRSVTYHHLFHKIHVNYT